MQTQRKALLSIMRRLGVRIILAAMVLMAAGLLLAATRKPSRSPRQSPIPSSQGAAMAMPQAVSPPAYPRGHWRLANPMDLTHVPLWISHILIRFKGVNPFVPFHQGWAESTIPTRSREEAKEIAAEVFERARANPDGFAALAREVSEDEPTASLGGSWSGIDASALTRDSAILDAIATMAPGEISRPIATRYGIHILMRRERPAFDVVSGRFVVIPYSPGPNCLANATSAGCSHPKTEILSEAETLISRIRRSGGSLDAKTTELVPENTGTWTTWDAGELSRERELLAQLKVGEIGRPFESERGIKILQRTAPQVGPEYRVEVIQVRYFAGLPPEHRYSRESRRKLIESILGTLEMGADRFQEFRTIHCCNDVRVWRVGRDATELTNSVAAVRDGAIAHEVVENDSSFLIVRRVSMTPGPRPVEPPQLPRPEKIDILGAVKTYSGTGIQAELRELGGDCVNAFGLDANMAADVKVLHENVAASFSFDQDVSDREEALLSIHDEMQQCLSQSEFDRYWALFTERMTSFAMQLH